MALGFGIVGCGMISEFHARAIADINGAKLVACHDQIPESANRFATQHSIKAYPELKDFLADPAVEIVTICTPSGKHMEPAVAAARAGKHLIVEKPLEITLKRCDKIIDCLTKTASCFPRYSRPGFTPAVRRLRKPLTKVALVV